MGLTKPRAAQIFNLDYKQSTRVVTVVNVVLTGGAPSSVDGVSLLRGDRILVTGQTTGSQNGIYKVSVVGSGTDGTWIRTKDSDQTGEVEAGVIVMVTEGAEYADTQWKLITNDPIIIGTTALTFIQNYSANSISAGTSNVVVFDNADVTISSAGTANVLTISNTGISTTGLVSATGNVTGNFILGNGVFLTGVITSVANINSGNSNVTVVSPGGNITVGVGGVSDVAVFSTTGQFVTGSISATGNITGGNVGATRGAFTNIAGTLETAAQPNITSVGTLSSVSVTGNVQGGNLRTAGLISTSGGITAASVAGGVITGTSTSVTGAQTAASTVGGVITGSSVSVSGNVTGANLTTAGTATIGGFTISGNTIVSAGPTLTIDPNASGGVDGLVVIAGNLQVNGNTTTINSNVVSTNDLTINFANNAINSAAANGAGIEAGPIGSPYLTFLYNNISNVWTSSGGLSAVGNITGGNLSATSIAGILTTAAQTNITSLGTLSALSVTGNITGNNILGNGAGLSGINAFSNVTVTNGNSAVANSIADTLTLTAGDGITIVVDSATDTITIAALGSSEIFVDGADFGTVTEPVTESDDLGLVTELVDAESDLGTIVTSGIIYPDQFVLPSFTTTTLPSASVVGAMIYVTNETGGAVPAFSDGTNWRRVTDRAIVT
jgi:hypothetical protein